METQMKLLSLGFFELSLCGFGDNYSAQRLATLNINARRVWKLESAFGRHLRLSQMILVA